MCDFEANSEKNNILSLNKNLKLGDRIKQYENFIDYKLIIKPTDSYVVRLDGRCFSKFTKKFYKPFDIVFIKTMCLTMRDLVKEFDAQTGYTHSDEITLIFCAKCTEEEKKELEETKKDDKIQQHMFRGRIQKILSLISSYCSVRFNYNLNNLIKTIKTNYDSKFVELIGSYSQMFDGRIMIFNQELKYEILNHQIWRSILDCERNAISTYAHTFFGPKKILNKSGKEMIQIMKQEKNFDWNDLTQVPIFIKHGIYCKKNLIEKEVDGQKILRSEYIFKQFKINFSESNLNLLLSKYWNDENLISNDKLAEIDLDLISC